MLKSKKEETPSLGSSVAKRPSGPLEVGTPFYQDGQLQVRVYWKNRGGTNRVGDPLSALSRPSISKNKEWSCDRFSLGRKTRTGIRRRKHNKRSSVSLWESAGGPKPPPGEEQINTQGSAAAAGGGWRQLRPGDPPFVWFNKSRRHAARRV